MNEAARLKYLKVALRVVGLVAIFGLHVLSVVWPSGWVWSAGRSEYFEMIEAIYATLGVFLLIAARDPEQHLILISFTIWSSLAHGVTMALQAFIEPRHMHHLLGDVPALFVIAAILGFLSPRALRLQFA